MSKVDESSWITLSITITPDDFMELEDTIADLRWQAGTSSAFLEHIVEQYKLKREELYPQTFTNEDLLFIQELVRLGKSHEGLKIIQSSPYITRKIVDLHDKYGSDVVDKTMQGIKKHEGIHDRLLQG